MSTIDTVNGIRVTVTPDVFEDRERCEALRKIVGPDEFRQLAEKHGPTFPDGPRSEWPAETKAKYLRLHGVDSYFGR